MLVIAHRGLSAHYPENTILSFEQAIQGGAKAIECDVHQVEESFVIFHDFHLKRLTGAEGSIRQSTIESIRQLRVDTSHPIPTLQEVFHLCAGKALLNLELKRINDPVLFVRQLCDCVNDANSEYADIEIVLSSFNHPLLLSIKSELRDTQLAHKVKIAGLIGHLPINNAIYALNLQADIAAIDADLVSAEFVEHAHQHHLDVWCYTVNHEDLLRKLLKMGVNGIFTDDSTWAAQMVSQIKVSL